VPHGRHRALPIRDHCSQVSQGLLSHMKSLFPGESRAAADPVPALPGCRVLPSRFTADMHPPLVTHKLPPFPGVAQVSADGWCVPVGHLRCANVVLWWYLLVCLRCSLFESTFGMDLLSVCSRPPPHPCSPEGGPSPFPGAWKCHCGAHSHGQCTEP